MYIRLRWHGSSSTKWYINICIQIFQSTRWMDRRIYNNNKNIYYFCINWQWGGARVRRVCTSRQPLQFANNSSAAKCRESEGMQANKLILNIDWGALPFFSALCVCPSALCFCFNSSFATRSIATVKQRVIYIYFHAHDALSLSLSLNPYIYLYIKYICCQWAEERAKRTKIMYILQFNWSCCLRCGWTIVSELCFTSRRGGPTEKKKKRRYKSGKFPKFAYLNQ